MLRRGRLGFPVDTTGSKASSGLCVAPSEIAEQADEARPMMKPTK